jgi:hypothetical protein
LAVAVAGALLAVAVAAVAALKLPLICLLQLMTLGPFELARVVSDQIYSQCEAIAAPVVL